VCGDRPSSTKQAHHRRRYMFKRHFCSLHTFFQKWLLLHILIITSICFALLETIKKSRCLWKIIFFSHIFLIYKLNDVNNVCRIFCRHISSFELTFCWSLFSFKNIDCFLVKNDKQSSILSLFVYTKAKFVHSHWEYWLMLGLLSKNKHISNDFWSQVY